MTNFEKWMNSLNLGEEKKLMPIAKLGWIAALEWALEQNTPFDSMAGNEMKVIMPEIVEEELEKINEQTKAAMLSAAMKRKVN